MNNGQSVIKCRIKGLNDAEEAKVLAARLSALPGVQRVDVNFEKRLARIVGEGSLDFAALTAAALTAEFEIENFDEPQRLDVTIDGMTCRSCEVKIERALRALDGVESASANASRGAARLVCTPGRAPDLARLQSAVEKFGYTVRPAGSAPTGKKDRPSFWQLVGLFILVLALGYAVERLGWLRPTAAVGAGSGLVATFLLGLVAASSSCVAVSGGLLLSATAKYRERYGTSGLGGKMRPVLLFVVGRLAAYGLLGGVIGLVGRALTPSPLATAAITVLAAFYMLVMGLEMLHLAPPFLRALLPRLPKRLGHRLLAAEGREHPAVPLLLGVGTFFLPCGFTQALQLYALTTGSFFGGALPLLAFALGTAPALLALGWASSSLQGRAGRFFFRFSGALVVLLGFWNIQNGLAIAGYPLTLPHLAPPILADTAESPSTDPNVVFDGQKQSVNINVSWNGYSPNHFTLRAGVPTVFRISGAAATGCLSVFTVPQLGIRERLDPAGVTEIPFTPTASGSYTFACSMGMYRGSFDVTS